MDLIRKSNFDGFIGEQTLLYGETNRGKTQSTANFVQFLVESKKIPPKEITILDFAPNLEIIKGKKIGGRIEDYYTLSFLCNNLTFDGVIIPPRLKSTSRKELYDNICKNYKKSSSIMEKYIDHPTPILIINDVSIYLHLGSKKTLLNLIKQAKTFFGNTYSGDSIISKTTKLLSILERKKVDFLIKNVNNPIFAGNLIFSG